MVIVVNRQPTGGLMVQADRLGPKVGGHLAPCCAHRVNQGELSQCFKHDDSTINIVEVLLLLLLLLQARETVGSFKTALKTYPLLRRLHVSPNCPGILLPCNDCNNVMLIQRVRNCRRYSINRSINQVLFQTENVHSNNFCSCAAI